MPKLSDAQAILLCTATQRTDGNLLPPPHSLGALSDRIRASIAALIKRSLAAEQPVEATAHAWREDGQQKIGAIITDAGRRAIGVDLDAEEPDPEARPEVGIDDVMAPTSSGPRPTKTALVLALLRREQGATLVELATATDWLPHTTRAALTGLRKKGHGIDRGKRNDATCYSLADVA